MDTNESLSFWAGFFCGVMAGMLGLSIALQFPIARAFDDPSSYARQGYHQCDSPSGWCDNEKENNPCGK